MSEQNGPNIHFNNINVNGMQINSGVFIGDNQQSLWSNHGKTNAGLGTTSGDCLIYQPQGIVIDPDWYDFIKTKKQGSF